MTGTCARLRGVTDDDDFSRRVFVQRLSFFGGGVVLLGAACKKEEAKVSPPPALTTSHRSFTNEAWLTLVAAVDRLLPRDEDAGGVDAGVPEYIDRMLTTGNLPHFERNFSGGLAALDRRAERMFQKRFHEATTEQQDELMAIFKDSPPTSGEARWYEMLLVLSLEGFLGDPSYGGNKGEVGWKLVGFNLVGRNVKGDPQAPYDGSKTLHHLHCGGGKGC